MAESIDVLVDNLDSSSITVSVLEMLDFVAPGQWTNVTGFDNLITHVTGETAPGIVSAIRREALEIWSDPGNRYDEALMILEGIDTVDRVAAGATVANKIGGLFGGLDFLEKYTPKPETTQSIDAALKLIAELLAFGCMNGLPDGSFEQIADFVIGLQTYAKDDIMRISSWIVIDGLLPLGPNFMGVITNTVSDAASSALSNNAIFGQISERIPGDGVDGKQRFILEALTGVSGWVGEFVAANGLTRERVVQELSKVVEVTEDKLDYVAAGLDASTNYFAHTGAQTVGRQVIKEGYQGLRDRVWEEWVAANS